MDGDGFSKRSRICRGLGFLGKAKAFMSELVTAQAPIRQNMPNQPTTGLTNSVRMAVIGAANA